MATVRWQSHGPCINTEPYVGGCAPASAFSSAAARWRTAALISFIATRTLLSGSMSVTSVWMICGFAVTMQ